MRGRLFLFGSFLVVFLMLVSPSINAVEYNLAKETVERDVVTQIQSNLKIFQMKNILEQISSIHLIKSRLVLDLFLVTLLIIGGVMVPTIFIVIGEVLIKILSPTDLVIGLTRYMEGFVIGLVASYIDGKIEEKYGDVIGKTIGGTIVLVDILIAYLIAKLLGNPTVH